MYIYIYIYTYIHIYIYIYVDVGCVWTRQVSPRRVKIEPQAPVLVAHPSAGLFSPFGSGLEAYPRVGSRGDRPASWRRLRALDTVRSRG